LLVLQQPQWLAPKLLSNFKQLVHANGLFQRIFLHFKSWLLVQVVAVVLHSVVVVAVAV
jgi:hypothetical protein